jgi:antagonist of KipI
MSLRIVKPGICTTIQDMGRYGYRAAGEAVIEMSFPAPVMVFEQAAVIAIAGAEFTPSVNGIIIQNCRPYFVQPGDVLAFEQKKWGAWAYLAVRGGFAVPQWLGSYATCLSAAAGGFRGRLLQKADELEFQKTALVKQAVFNWQLAEKEWRQWYDADNVIKVLPGNELALLSDAEAKKLFTQDFTVTNQSNRMGYRLSGPALQLSQAVELVSSAVTKGTVQLLPSADCIVLMADHQTTGGYPRIAHVTGVSIPAMAQAQGAAAIKFRLITIEAAEESLFSMQQWLQQVRMSCGEKYNGGS